MTLTKKVLPNTIQVGNHIYEVKTDFQYWLIFIKLIKDKHQTDGYITQNDIAFLFAPFVLPSKIEDLKAIYNALLEFAFPPKELPRTNAQENTVEAIDYEEDAQLIYSAFYQCYNIDLFNLDLHLHYHKFKALLEGIKDTHLNDIIDIRLWKASKNDSAEYKAKMKKLQSQWEIKPPLTQEEKQALADFDEKLKKKE